MSFTDIATLIVDDKSTKPLKSIRKEVNELIATVKKLSNKSVKIDVQLRNAAKTKSDLNIIARHVKTLDGKKANVTVAMKGVVAAQNQLTKLRAQAATPITQQVIVNRRTNNAGVPPVGRTPPGANNVPGGMFGGRISNSYWNRAGTIVGNAASIALGQSITVAFRNMARAGYEGLSDLDRVQAVAGASGIDTKALTESARKAADDTLGVSQAEIISAATEQAGALQVALNTAIKADVDAVRAGTMSVQQQMENEAKYRAEFNKNLDRVTMRTAQMAQIFGTATGDFRTGAEDARQIEKAVSQSNAGLDQDRKDAFAGAISAAILASGGDIKGDEVKRMMQQMGGVVKSALSPEGVARAIMARDEGGRMATGELRMSLQDAFRGSLNPDDLEAQIASGLRVGTAKNKKGRWIQGSTVFTEADMADPFGWVEKHILPAVKAAGINLQDSIAVNDYIDNVMGFTTSGSRFITDAITKLDQYSSDFERFKMTKPGELLKPTIDSSMAEIRSAFKDAVGKKLIDNVDTIKGGALGVADIIEKYGNTGRLGLKDMLGLGAAGVGLGLMGSLDANPATAALSLAGVTLTGAGTALTGAAAALTGAAAVQSGKTILDLFKSVGLSAMGGALYGGSLAFMYDQQPNSQKLGTEVGRMAAPTKGAAAANDMKRLTSEIKSLNSELTNLDPKRPGADIDSARINREINAKKAELQAATKIVDTLSQSDLSGKITASLDPVSTEAASASNAVRYFGDTTYSAASSIDAVAASMWKIAHASEVTSPLRKKEADAAEKVWQTLQDAAKGKGVAGATSTRELQARSGAEVDGVFGKQTREAVDRMIAQANDYAKASEQMRRAQVQLNAEREAERAIKVKQRDDAIIAQETAKRAAAANKNATMDPVAANAATSFPAMQAAMTFMDAGDKVHAAVVNLASSGVQIVTGIGGAFDTGTAGLVSGIISGGAQAAAAMAAAIANAGANIKVNVQQTVSAPVGANNSVE